MKYFSFSSALIFLGMNLSLLRNGFAQSSATASFHYGIYLANSENSLPIIGTQSVRGFAGFAVGYAHACWNHIALGIDAGYSASTVDRIQQFVESSPNGPFDFTYFYAHMSFKQFFGDFNIRYSVNERPVVGGGPSLAIVHRTVYTDPINVQNATTIQLEDMLASSGIGLNGLIQARFPFGGSRFAVITGAKFRYIHSIWFDKGERDLSNYSQSFLSGNLFAGTSYDF